MSVTVPTRAIDSWFIGVLAVTLNVSGIDTSVTVTADVIALEAARTQIAGTVSEAEVRSLPMNGRNFLDLALHVPGVSPTNVGSAQLFPETSAVPGVSWSDHRSATAASAPGGAGPSDDTTHLGLTGSTHRPKAARSSTNATFEAS